MKLILNNEFGLYQEDRGGIFCDSLMIADTFTRQHKHVLDTIKILTEPTSGLSEEFRHLNFKESSYKDASGKNNKKYLLTKDGFVMVTMKFKTKKARAFKEAYINRFNQMEQYINVLSEVRLDFPELTEVIQHFYIEPKGFHYSNEMDMINRIALGMTAKKFKEI